MKLGLLIVAAGAWLPAIVHAQRSVHRRKAPDMPRITVWSSSNPTRYTLEDYNLKPIPLFKTYDQKHFEQHLVPENGIDYDNGTKHISKKKIDKIIEHLMHEIKLCKRAYRDFKILKQSDFVRPKKYGLLIIKFKKYPFVLKLFIEPPYSFVNPYDKGFTVISMFIAGGGLRHTLGFTRIKTLEYVKEYLAQDRYWCNRIILPRKWFWLPSKPEWLFIETKNIGSDPQAKHANQCIKMPATYGVIADELVKDPEKTPDFDELMAFSKFVEHRIDPHTKNFFIEKNTGKIALIDTELFPFILGFDKKIDGQDTHLSWYAHLAKSYLARKYGSFKNERRQRQYSLESYYA